MKRKYFYIVFASTLLILFTLMYEGSYAYFNAAISGTGSKKTIVKTNEFKDIIISNTSVSSSSTLMPGESVSTTFTINNPNSVSVCFDLLWNNVNNTFLSKNDLVVTLTKNGTEISLGNSIFPSTNDGVLTSLSIKANTTDTYKLTVTYKETDKDQSADMKKTFSGIIVGSLKECALAGYVSELASTDTTNLAIDDYGNTRYIGKNPNNYVSVDGDIWRIIGTMKDVDDGTGNKEDRVKLIRTSSIGSYSWDTSESSVNDGRGINEWSQADLMKLLNPGYESESVGGSLYWNNQSGKCYYSNNNGTTSCNFTSTGIKDKLKTLISDAVWNTGANDDKTYTYNNIITSKFYELERSSNTCKICSSGDYCNDTVERTTTWTGKVGLMYPSDYGYATSGGSTTDRAACLNKELYNWSDSSVSDCKNNDWLINSSYQWTISPYADSSRANLAFLVGSGGTVNPSYAFTDFAVLPVVYLTSSVGIESGDGSSGNPFTLKS